MQSKPEEGLAGQTENPTAGSALLGNPILSGLRVDALFPEKFHWRVMKFGIKVMAVISGGLCIRLRRKPPIFRGRFKWRQSLNAVFPIKVQPIRS